MKHTLTALAVVGLLAAGSHADAATILYSADATALSAAISPLEVEDFSDATLLPDITLTALAKTIVGGHLESAVQSNKTLAIGFADPIFGFGVDYDLSRGGVTSGLNVSVGFVDGTTQTLNAITMAKAAGFYGFTSDLGVRSVTFSSGPGESFDLDNLRFGSALAIAGVPEPASWALMILGFGGAGMAIRRRRAILATL